MNKAKEISALWEQIKPQIDEMVHLCYEVESHYEVTADAYQRGYDEGYQQGLNDERHKKASCQYCRYTDKGEDDEPCNSCCFRYHNMFKPEEKIKVGDEVKSAEGNIGIVTRLFGDGIYVTWTDGTSGFHKADGFEKTGKHFSEIAEVLAKMKEADNG